MDHLDDGLDPLPVLAQPIGIGSVIFDFGGCIGAITKLVLEPDYAKTSVALPIRCPARDDKAGQPLFRIGQRQKRIEPPCFSVIAIPMVTPLFSRDGRTSGS